ncbi:MAG: 5-guanidino-2-oxopentanoate decarboxylase [Rhodospirillaceae bacterium]|nr:5-guanidino-2-oxopentanoate decarboxylase [Rhodospirillaceae bacterium]
MASSNLTRGQALMQTVKAYGIDTVFGMPGVHTLEYYRGISDADMRHVLFRHEQGGGFMADGYARISGKPAVCCVITGPGVTNIATAVGNAYADSQPMLVIASTNGSGDLGAGRGRLHEITDQLAVIKPLTAFAQTIHDGRQIPGAINRAFDIFATGRPRPCYIELPIDKIAEAAEFAVETSPIAGPMRPAEESIEKAAAVASGARKPVIIAGGGVLDHGAALQALAEKLGAAVILTIAAKGAIPDDHPLNVSAALVIDRAHRFIEDADLVIAIGTELSETDIWIQDDFLHLSGKLIRIDIDPANLSRDYTPAAAILGDGRLAMEMLADALPANNGSAGFAGSSVVADLRKAVMDDMMSTPLSRKHAKVLDALRAAIPHDGWMITDATQVAYFANGYWSTSHPRSYTHPSGYCTLGSAMPSAIGAKIGVPERHGVALAGDAGFLFTGTEMATAVDEKVALPIIVWNNDCLGQIRDGLLERDIEPIGVTPGRNPDFPAFAKSFGAYGHKATSLSDLTGSVKDAFEADGPTLIEVHENSDFLS